LPATASSQVSGVNSIALAAAIRLNRIVNAVFIMMIKGRITRIIVNTTSKSYL
jgi:hypothetical protein